MCRHDPWEKDLYDNMEKQIYGQHGLTGSISNQTDYGSAQGIKGPGIKHTVMDDPYRSSDGRRKHVKPHQQPEAASHYFDDHFGQGEIDYNDHADFRRGLNADQADFGPLIKSQHQAVQLRFKQEAAGGYTAPEHVQLRAVLFSKWEAPAGLFF